MPKKDRTLIVRVEQALMARLGARRLATGTTIADQVRDIVVAALDEADRVDHQKSRIRKCA